MTCEIKKDGMLVIKSETEIESYALYKWAESNFSDNRDMNLLLDWSNIRE